MSENYITKLFIFKILAPSNIKFSLRPWIQVNFLGVLISDGNHKPTITNRQTFANLIHIQIKTKPPHNPLCLFRPFLQTYNWRLQMRTFILYSCAAFYTLHIYLFICYIIIRGLGKIRAENPTLILNENHVPSHMDPYPQLNSKGFTKVELML